MLINPRIGSDAIGAPDDNNESAATLDQGYGFTSPMTNIKPTVDTLLCHTFNTYEQRLGGSVVVMKKTLITDPTRLSAAAVKAMVQKLRADTHINFIEVGKLELWDIELPEGALNGWNTTAEPALMCDVERFLAKGSVIRNNSFHHTTCNLGRTKSSDSIIEHNTWAYGGSNMEITGLENWMEGPMLINNVTVRNNTFLGAGDGNHDVHPSPQATNITISDNLPGGGNYPPPTPPGPPLPPSNRTAFCKVGSEGPCEQELKGVAVVGKCSADVEHVEQHMLPPHAVSVDALHVDVEGNGHTDVTVVGVIYSDVHGRPGQLLGTSDPVVVEAHVARSFVRLPFSHKGGLPITPGFAGQTVWLGEQAGRPATTMTMTTTTSSSSSSSSSSGGGGQSGGNATDPPGPLDLACFGFPASASHRPCMYTPQPFASKPKATFGAATVCSSSVSVFATTA